MLTRKYYKEIAEIINRSSDKQEIVNELCCFFKQDNPNFKKDKFKQVCFKRS